MGSDRYRRGVIAFAFVMSLAMVAPMIVDYVHASKFGNDFGVYWRTANNPLELAYAPVWRFPFPYAPTMLFWITPLGFMPRWPAYALFCLGSGWALYLAVKPYLSRAEMALLFVCPAFVRGMFTGQVSALLASLTIWACGTANRVGAGVAFGLIASVKPQLVLMAPLMLALDRDWKAFVSAGVTFVAAILVALVLYGPEPWSQWVASMNYFHSAVVDLKVFRAGVSPALIAERFGLPSLPFMFLGMGIGAATVYWCRDREPLEKAAAITLGSLLASPYGLAYDLVAVVPFLVLATFRGRIFAGLAIFSSLYPLPLLISAYELLRTVQLRRLRNA